MVGTRRKPVFFMYCGWLINAGATSPEGVQGCSRLYCQWFDCLLLTTQYFVLSSCVCRDVAKIDNQRFHFTFIWPCIVTDFFIIKPTGCTNFTNLFWHETLHASDSSSVHHHGVHSLYTQQWYIEELSEACRVSCQNKFVKLVHLVGFIIKESAFSCPDVLPSAHPEQLNFHRSDFRVIWYWGFLLKLFSTLQFWLQ
jgi:hypothetical protein